MQKEKTSRFVVKLPITINIDSGCITGNLILMLRLLKNTTFSTAVHRASDSGEASSSQSQIS